MKRLLSLLLCAAILLSFAACGSSGEEQKVEPTAAPTLPVTEAPTEEPTAAPTEAPTEPAPVQTAPENLTIVDTDQASFLLEKVEASDHMGMRLYIQCINNTDRALTFSWDQVSVCGYMYDPGWFEEISAGKTVRTAIDLDTYELENMGVPSVDEITFTLRIFDSENWMEGTVVQDVFTIYPTGLNADTLVLPQREPDPAQVVVAEDENLSFIIEWVDAENPDEYVVYVYAENRSDRNLMYTWDPVSINGVSVNSFWTLTVAAGKKACSKVVFPRAELADAGINDVSRLDFTLLVSDYDDWEGDTLLEKSVTYQP